MNRGHLSDEALQALIDGEYSATETAELMERLRTDPEARQRVYELRMLKDTVRLGYEGVPQPERGGKARARGGAQGWRSIAAAAALLGLGMLTGWALHSGTAAPERVVLIDSEGRGAQPAQVQSREMRIVFHLTDPDMTAAGELLDEIERMLLDYEASEAPLRVEVVAHGEGLDVLRERLSRHRARIEAMAVRYENLSFVACQNTIDRLRVEQGIEVVLLPQATVTESGVDHVVRRQREGWVYIRV
jgi:intracellular sulfur oxidation DsrE/DsrF family protein